MALLFSKNNSSLHDLARDSTSQRTLQGLLFDQQPEAANNNNNSNSSGNDSTRNAAAGFISPTTPNLFSATLLDKQGKSIAVAMLVRINAMQAYCMMGEVAAEWRRRTVWVEWAKADDDEETGNDDANQRHLVGTVTRFMEGAKDLSGLPAYFRAFADHEGQAVVVHLLDELTRRSIGTLEMDLRKNITIDLCDADSLPTADWRDLAGFVVGDKVLFHEITIAKEAAVKAVGEAPTGFNVVKVVDKELDQLLDYDSEVTVYNRGGYLEHLLAINGVSAFVMQSSDKMTCGYAIVLQNRILSLVAETEDGARC